MKDFSTTNRPRANSVDALESALRAQALHARHTPSAKLRQRTLDALRDVPATSASDIHQRHRRAVAAMALCACALAASILAFSLPPSKNPADTKAVAITAANSSSSAAKSTPSSKSNLLKTSFVQQVSFKDPLVSEARLLAHDAQRTLTVFQAGLPRSPLNDRSRLSTPAATPAGR